LAGLVQSNLSIFNFEDTASMLRNTILIPTILLIGLFFFLMQRHYVIDASSVYKDGAAIICESKRHLVRSNQINNNKRINTFFIGNSKILTGLIPDYFDMDLNGAVTSFNLSLPALPVGPHYYCLKDYIKNNTPPQYIVIYLSTYRGMIDSMAGKLVRYYCNQGSMSFHELLSYSIFFRDPWILIYHILPQLMFSDFVDSYTFNNLFHKDDIIKIREHNMTLLTRMVKDRGYYFIEEQARFPDKALPEDFSEDMHPNQTRPIFDVDSDIFLDKFFRFTSSEGIKVLLIEPPYRRGQYSQFSEIPAQYKAILQRYDNVYIAPDGWKTKFYENRYFSDPTHLNHEGAILYTREIAHEFAELFHLGPDRCGIP